MTYRSYVLYKGMFSVYPYVWLYKLAVILNLNELFFIKAFYAMLFAYLVTLGLPQVIKNLTNYVAKTWQIIILTVVCFFAWYRTFALTQMLVDLPSAAIFLLVVNASFCFSGQYIPATICICLFLFFKLDLVAIIKGNKEHKSIIISGGGYLLHLQFAPKIFTK